MTSYKQLMGWLFIRGFVPVDTMEKQHAVGKSPILTGSIALWLSLVLFLNTGVQAQANLQDQAARAFMTALFDEDFSRAWGLLEPEVQKTTTLEAVKAAAKPTNELAAQYGKALEEFMRGPRTYQNGQTVFVYSYKFKSDVAKGMPSALIDITFKNAQSTAIYGFMPRFSTRSQPGSARVSTSSGQEVSLGNEQEWTVDGKKVIVNELALVLDDNQALFIIKVMDEEARTLDQQTARSKAIPIVKYAVANGYRQKAESGASQAKRKLLENIGVAFIQPGTRAGFRVQITPDDYAK